jgi:transcriptional regulator with XRE-family HTH domain
MGRRLKKLREERDMSRAELAKRAGISREYVRLLESGSYDPTVGTLQNLARALGVALTDLLG